MNKNKEMYIVGIGASAGGLEALESFFKNVPNNTNMAFVVIQHLSPDYKSLMVELLSRYTDIKIHRAEDGMKVIPNSVYLIPPKKNMTIFHNSLYLSEKKSDQILNLPIDIFFKSLAEDQGEKSIGIILSGTGSDGTRGIKAIKEVGGMVMAQEETSAKFDGMPRNAVLTGLVDYILTPEEMPDQLIKYIDHPFWKEELKKDTVEERDKKILSKIFSMLRNYAKVDFTFYKQTTILRRIERRISIKQLDSFEGYLDYIRVNPEEIKTLYKDLLIGVTRFFRDDDAFKEIEKSVIPEIINSKKNNDLVRVWITGCSTGEEAYSIAILIKDYIDKINKPLEIKIFATDIDKESIEKASLGLYNESIAADIDIKLLKKYFTKEGNYYQVNRDIREMMIFASHNILKDPPFYKMDLISCRNMLIYFQSVLQKKVLTLFHFALKKDGFLFLGNSETTGDMNRYYIPFNSKYKIYKTNNSIKSDLTDNFKFNNLMRTPLKEDFDKKISIITKDNNKSFESLYKSIIDNYMIPILVVNKNYEIVLIGGNAEKYLRFSSGVFSYNILKLVHNDLSIALGTALHKAIKTKKNVEYTKLKIKINDSNELINLKVFYEYVDKLNNDFLIILFESYKEEKSIIDDSENYNIDEKTEQRIKDLENELQNNKENLQATIEELETSNEELQATNEELLSSNEELQSTNEELQSVNEELITVNSEYQLKIQELQELNNDIENLLKSSNIATIFLDKDLKIRKFTPAAKELINFIDNDIGRPISHISHNVKNTDLTKESKGVLLSLDPLEEEVLINDNQYYLKRILPYKTHDNNVKGVVITFVNVNDVKKTTVELENLYKAVDQSSNMFILTNNNGIMEYVNKSVVDVTGYSKEDLINKSTNIFKSEKTPQKTYNELWENIQNGVLWTGELINKKKNGDIFHEKATITPIKNYQGKIVNYFKVSENITEKRKVESIRRNEQEALVNIMENSNMGFILIDLEGYIKYANTKSLEYLEIKNNKINKIDLLEKNWIFYDIDNKKYSSNHMFFSDIIKKKISLKNKFIKIYFNLSNKTKCFFIDSNLFYNKDNEVSAINFSIKKSEIEGCDCDE